MSLKPKPVDFEETWILLGETVDGVITLNNVPRSVWSERFTDVYALCVAMPDPLSDRLYEETKKLLELHVKNLYKTVSTDQNVLRKYFECWSVYSQGTEFLNLLYLYLNTQHIKKQKVSEADCTYGNVEFRSEPEQMLEIGELALNLWKTYMIEPLKRILIDILLQSISSDRKGESTNQEILNGVISSFVKVETFNKRNPLELYSTLFETPFLEATGAHYRCEASGLWQKCNTSAYMEKVIQKIDEENLRSRKFLDPSSYAKVTEECQQRLVGDHLLIFNGESKQMVKDENKKDLSNLYTILKPIKDGLAMLVTFVQEHIQENALSAITAVKVDSSPVAFVEAILEVNKRYDDLIRSVYQYDSAFQGALHKALVVVVNHKVHHKMPCKSPELLSKYCDQLLKKSAKGYSESEIDDKLSHSIVVFKYIDDKDTFKKFYSKTLAKRLIHSQSVSMEAEEAMINRLKQTCGYEFTNKMHRMYTDISLSSDLNNKFQTSLKAQEYDLGLNFFINVLQAVAWPLGPGNLSPFAIPQELEKSVKKFEEFYHSSFNGRKLTWVHHLCTAEVKLNYLAKTYAITMSTFQMAIMLMFESTNSLTLREIRDNLQLNDDQLTRNIHSLVEAKLLKTDAKSDGAEPQESDQVPLVDESILRLNTEYSNKRTKFKITAATQKESVQQEIEATHNSVEEDRKLYLQASIVRIMKARKTTDHNTLIQEVIGQARGRFSPNIPIIKKCIEALIDKQYIERVQGATDRYSYIA